MKNISSKVIPFALATAFTTSTSLFAGKDEHRREMRHPVKESIDACKDKKVGDACSFEMPRGKMEGKCIEHMDRPLHCRPNNMPGHHGEGHGEMEHGEGHMESEHGEKPASK